MKQAISAIATAGALAQLLTGCSGKYSTSSELRDKLNDAGYSCGEPELNPMVGSTAGCSGFEGGYAFHATEEQANMMREAGRTSGASDAYFIIGENWTVGVKGEDKAKEVSKKIGGKVEAIAG